MDYISFAYCKMVFHSVVGSAHWSTHRYSLLATHKPNHSPGGFYLEKCMHNGFIGVRNFFLGSYYRISIHENGFIAIGAYETWHCHSSDK